MLHAGFQPGTKAVSIMSGFFGTINRSQAELMKSLQQEERVTDKTAQTMLQVARKYFLDPDNKETQDKAYQVPFSKDGDCSQKAYDVSNTQATGVIQDHPLSIGYGETISAPHMHAEALRLLENHCSPGATVLDVGSGQHVAIFC